MTDLEKMGAAYDGAMETICALESKLAAVEEKRDNCAAWAKRAEDTATSIRGERNALRHKLKKAEERAEKVLCSCQIKTFEDERDALKSKLAESSRLLWGAVHNAGRGRRRGIRWGHLVDTLGTGSTSAQHLCRQHGADPDEMTGDDDEGGPER